jgi:hypothetical protein
MDPTGGGGNCGGGGIDVGLKAGGPSNAPGPFNAAKSFDVLVSAVTANVRAFTHRLHLSSL